jgi:hypothetical protein
MLALGSAASNARRGGRSPGRWIKMIKKIGNVFENVYKNVYKNLYGKFIWKIKHEMKME